MIEFTDTRPAVEIVPEEYVRLLGYPRGHVLADRAAELGAWARAWYAEHGRPWMYARETAAVSVNGGGVLIEGSTFNGARLRRTIVSTAADRVVLVAVGAGPEAEQAALACWQGERPDEYYFLDVYASAVVEHLAMAAGARLCGLAEPEGRSVLPHDSPGYPGWHIGEQARLLDVIRGGVPGRLPSPIEVLDSGALRPRKALLAVFAVTGRIEEARRVARLTPCENCTLSPCAYRRAPFRRGRRTGTTAECR